MPCVVLKIFRGAPTLTRSATQSQQVLSGAAPTDAGSLFLEGDKKTLECHSVVDEARIRNNTCVLSPETTQGGCIGLQLQGWSEANPRFSKVRTITTGATLFARTWPSTSWAYRGTWTSA